MRTYYRVNGIGMRLFGRREYQEDGTYLSTMWFTLLWIPLVPLYSVRVAGDIDEQWSEVSRRMPPRMRQVVETYLFAAGVLGILLIAGEAENAFWLLLLVPWCLLLLIYRTWSNTPSAVIEQVEPLKLAAVKTMEPSNELDVDLELTRAQYLSAFLSLLGEYLVDESGHMRGPPEYWQWQGLSYSVYLGLGMSRLDPALTNRLNEGLTPGMLQTADLHLAGLKATMQAEHAKPGELWMHALSFLNSIVSLTSPETTGKGASESLVKARMPVAGLIPALRLSKTDPKLASLLYADAIQERQLCDDEELLNRVAWMKARIAEACKGDAQSRRLELGT